jgi:hypothetical protein
MFVGGCVFDPRLVLKNVTKIAVPSDVRTDAQHLSSFFRFFSTRFCPHPATKMLTPDALH